MRQWRKFTNDNQWNTYKWSLFTHKIVLAQLLENIFWAVFPCTKSLQNNLGYSQFSYFEELNIFSMIHLIKMNSNWNITQNDVFKVHWIQFNGVRIMYMSCTLVQLNGTHLNYSSSRLGRLGGIAACDKNDKNILRWAYGSTCRSIQT